MEKKKKNDIGFSLIEMMIAASLLAGASFFMADYLIKEKKRDDYVERMDGAKEDLFLTIEHRIRVAFERRRNITAGALDKISNTGYGFGVISESGFSDITADRSGTDMTIAALAITATTLVSSAIVTTSCRVYNVTIYTDCIPNSNLPASTISKLAGFDFTKITNAAGSGKTCQAGERPIVKMKRVDYVNSALSPVQTSSLIPAKDSGFTVQDEIVSAAIAFKQDSTLGYITAKLAVGVFDYSGNYNILKKTMYLGTGQYVRHGIVKNICSIPETCCKDDYDYPP